MKFIEITSLTRGKNFPAFENAALVVGINAKGCSEYSRKQIDELTEFVKRPQVGAKGLQQASQCVSELVTRAEIGRWPAALRRRCIQSGDAPLRSPRIARP